ncbi:hypothetical protein PAAG_05725 [Paracoccidioides lutzii Pb01]|uniref:Uncharacterized protein n=1 Tax=Paracoccidioides lutzii (strain ATCC MYA-826 / Pb01) TaxID=502779 RepID=C1H4N2_PARBA|nr:hypothetical protein PAAG_05725 [Paracoccidioides lutzii Pb01]EEH34676.2 hypothetical protein PAAG_05725 [Paracoccidioides lutzii Pb01]
MLPIPHKLGRLSLGDVQRPLAHVKHEFRPMNDNLYVGLQEKVQDEAKIERMDTPPTGPIGDDLPDGIITSIRGRNNSPLCGLQWRRGMCGGLAKGCRHSSIFFSALPADWGGNPTICLPFSLVAAGLQEEIRQPFPATKQIGFNSLSNLGGSKHPPRLWPFSPRAADSPGWKNNNGTGLSRTSVGGHSRTAQTSIIAPVIAPLDRPLAAPSQPAWDANEQPPSLRSVLRGSGAVECFRPPNVSGTGQRRGIWDLACPSHGNLTDPKPMWKITPTPTSIHLQLSAPAVESWQSSTLTSPVPPAKRLAQPAAIRILTKTFVIEGGKSRADFCRWIETAGSRQLSGGSAIVFEKGERFSIRQLRSEAGNGGKGSSIAG